MANSVSLGSFPHTSRLDIFQGDSAAPGRIIWEGPPQGTTTLPRTTTISVTNGSFVGTWPNCRISKPPISRYGRIRCVLEDERWKLRESTCSNNYNNYNSLGERMTGSEATISTLVGHIATASDFANLIVGTVPSVYPPARWSGMRADLALQDLLDNTGCRVTYNAVSGKYVVNHCNTGSVPSIGDTMYEPAPSTKLATLNVRSAPTMHEERMACTAKQMNATTGETEDIPGTLTLGITADDDHEQTKLRLWQPDSISGKVLLPHRAKCHVFDPEKPVYEQARVIADEWEPFPVHQPMVRTGGTVVETIEPTGGGRAYITAHPVCKRGTGTKTYDKTATLLTAYYDSSGGDLARNSVSINLGGTGVKTIDLSWIRDVDSSEADMGSSQWGSVLSSFGNAISARYAGTTGHARLPYCVGSGGSGQVGAMQYLFELPAGSVSQRANILCLISLNYSPQWRGGIR